MTLSRRMERLAADYDTDGVSLRCQYGRQPFQANGPRWQVRCDEGGRSVLLAEGATWRKALREAESQATRHARRTAAGLDAA